MTETAAAGTFTHLFDFEPGSTGYPVGA